MQSAFLTPYIDRVGDKMTTPVLDDFMWDGLASLLTFLRQDLHGKPKQSYLVHPTLQLVGGAIEQVHNTVSQFLDNSD